MRVVSSFRSILASCSIRSSVGLGKPLVPSRSFVSTGDRFDQLVSRVFDGFPGVYFGEYKADKGRIECTVDYRFENWIAPSYFGVPIDKLLVTGGGACFDGILGSTGLDYSYDTVTPASFDNVEGMYMAGYNNDAIEVYCDWFKAFLLPRVINGTQIIAIGLHEPPTLCSNGTLTMMEDDDGNVSVGTNEIGFKYKDRRYWMGCGHSVCSYEKIRTSESIVEWNTKESMDDACELRVVPERMQTKDPMVAHDYFKVEENRSEFDLCPILAQVQGSFVTCDTKRGRALPGVDVALAPLIDSENLPKPSVWIDNSYVKKNFTADETNNEQKELWKEKNLYCIIKGKKHYLKLQNIHSFAYPVSFGNPSVAVRLSNALTAVNAEKPVDVAYLTKGKSGKCIYDENDYPFAMFTAIIKRSNEALYILQSVGNLTRFLEQKIDE